MNQGADAQAGIALAAALMPQAALGAAMLTQSVSNATSDLRHANCQGAGALASAGNVPAAAPIAGGAGGAGRWPAPSAPCAGAPQCFALCAVLR